MIEKKLKKTTSNNEQNDYSELLEVLNEKIIEYKEEVFILLDGTMSAGKTPFRKFIESNLNDVFALDLDDNFKNNQDFSKLTEELIFDENKIFNEIKNCGKRLILLDGIGSKRIFEKLFKNKNSIIVNMINNKNMGSITIEGACLQSSNYFKSYKDYIIHEIKNMKMDSLTSKGYVNFSEKKYINDIKKLKKTEIKKLFFEFLKNKESTIKGRNQSIITKMEEFNSSYFDENPIILENEIRYIISEEYLDPDKIILNVKIQYI